MQKMFSWADQSSVFIYPGTHKRRALRRYIQWTKVSIYYIGCPIDHVRPNQLNFYMYTRLVVARFYAQDSHHQYDDNTPASRKTKAYPWQLN